MCAESSAVFRLGRILSGPNLLLLLLPPTPRKSTLYSYGSGLLIVSITHLRVSSETLRILFHKS